MKFVQCEVSFIGYAKVYGEKMRVVYSDAFEINLHVLLAGTLILQDKAQ